MGDDTTRKPAWWNEKVAASWDKAKATAVSEWAKVTGLGDEWQRLGNQGEAAWDKVRETVKHQWQRASVNEPAAAPTAPTGSAASPDPATSAPTDPSRDDPSRSG